MFLCYSRRILTTWKVIKTLLNEVGFYRKKIIFFGSLIVLVIVLYFVWQNFFKSQAAVQFNRFPPNSYVSQSTMEVIIHANGNVYIDGKKQNRTLKFYQNYDELHILVFDEPGQFINSFKGIVNLPEGADISQIRQIIYAVHGVGSYRTYTSGPSTLIYEAHDISPTATLTIVADLPKGTINPNFWQRIGISLANLPVRMWLFVAIALPGITLLLMTFMIIKRRKDRLIIIRGFLGGPPEEIPPALAGVLIDGVVGAREIAATLVDLARRGYIFIINKGKGQFSFGIRRIGDFKTMSGLSPFERILLDKIFLPTQYKSSVSDVEMRIGRHVFSRKIAQFYLEIYNQATQRGLFVQNPARVHLIFKYLGIILFFLSFLGFMIGAIAGADPKLGLLFWVGGMIAAAVIIRLSPYMPARTKRGSQEVQEWLEFRQYLIDRKPASGQEIMQNKFEEYLPYAMVLGAEIDWAKRFGRQPFTKPEWYESHERVVTLDSFASNIFPLIGYVAQNLARSHEPTVE